MRAEWSIQIDERRAALNLAEEIVAEGRSWVELDESGAVVEHGASEGHAATSGRSDSRRSTTKRASGAGRSTKGRGSKRRAPD